MVKGSLYNNLLSKFVLLPNVFSRNYLLDVAIDSIKNSHLTDNYWSSMESSQKLGIQLISSPSPTLLDTITEWIQLINNFISFSTYIAFPLIEKCYFILLYEYYRKHNQNNALSIILEELKNFAGKNTVPLTYDFTDKELNELIFNEVTKTPENKDNEIDLFIKYFIDNYSTLNEQRKIENKKITPSILSGDELNFIYSVSHNIFNFNVPVGTSDNSQNNLEVANTIELNPNDGIYQRYNRTFTKEYFRLPRQKTADEKEKQGKFLEANKLPEYNKVFVNNQIKEILKIQKFNENPKSFDE